MILKPLNSRQKRRLNTEMSEAYGIKGDFLSGFEAFKDGDHTFICSRECLETDLEGFNVESIGLKAISHGLPTISCSQLLFTEGLSKGLDLESAQIFIGWGCVLGDSKIASYMGHPLDIAQTDGKSIRRIKR